MSSASNRVSSSCRMDARQGATTRCATGPLRVGFVLTKDFTLSAFSEFIDVLRLAADNADHSRSLHCQWYVMSASSRQVRSSCGLLVPPTAGLMPSSELDYVVVVGGLLRRNSTLDSQTIEYLLRMGRTRSRLVGVGIGSLVLCRLGLLESRKCSISWLHYRDFVQEFDNVVPVADQPYVIDGNRITCAGGVGTAYLAAELVARHLGEATAQKILHMLHMDRTSPRSNARPAPPQDSVGHDDRVARALLLMEQNLSRPLPIGHLAARLHTSPRELERLFKNIVGRSPRSTYLQLRLKHAKWMLSLEHSLVSVAANTGFSDGARFGKAFKAAYGVNPSE